MTEPKKKKPEHFCTACISNKCQIFAVLTVQNSGKTFNDKKYISVHTMNKMFWKRREIMEHSDFDKILLILKFSNVFVNVVMRFDLKRYAFS